MELKVPRCVGAMQKRRSEPRRFDRFGYDRSAGRLAAPAGIDFSLEFIEADGADNDIVADHVARRSIEAEGVRELEALFDLRADFIAVHVLFDLGSVESDVLGRCKGVGLVSLATAAE